MSPGHNGRGMTYSHAHRERKPPLDKVDIFCMRLFSSSAAVAYWQRDCRSLKVVRGSKGTERNQNG